MESMTMEDFRHLLNRAGLQLPQEEAKQLKAAYDEFQDQLKALHAADLDDEEVSGIFLP